MQAGEADDGWEGIPRAVVRVIVEKSRARQVSARSHRRPKVRSRGDWSLSFERVVEVTYTVPSEDIRSSPVRHRARIAARRGVQSRRVRCDTLRHRAGLPTWARLSKRTMCRGRGGVCGSLCDADGRIDLQSLRGRLLWPGCSLRQSMSNAVERRHLLLLARGRVRPRDALCEPVPLANRARELPWLRYGRLRSADAVRATLLVETPGRNVLDLRSRFLRPPCGLRPELSGAP